MMLADRFRTTTVALVTLALVILIRRQIDSFYVPPDVLNIINIVTVFMLCLVVVVIARAWMPHYKG
jgi:hypothetical protein